MLSFLANRDDLPVHSPNRLRIYLHAFVPANNVGVPVHSPACLLAHRPTGS